MISLWQVFLRKLLIYFRRSLAAKVVWTVSKNYRNWFSHFYVGFFSIYVGSGPLWLFFSCSDAVSCLWNIIVISGIFWAC